MASNNKQLESTIVNKNKIIKELELQFQRYKEQLDDQFEMEKRRLAADLDEKEGENIESPLKIAENERIKKINIMYNDLKETSTY